MKEIKKENKQVESIENAQEEAKQVFTISLTAMDNGTIALNVENHEDLDKQINAEIIEKVLYDSHKSLYEQRIISQAMEAFANKLR